MNPVILMIAAGYLFFGALLCLLAALVLLWRCRKIRWGVFLIVVGGLLLAVSATPVHWGFYSILSAVAVGFLPAVSVLCLESWLVGGVGIGYSADGRAGASLVAESRSRGLPGQGLSGGRFDQRRYRVSRRGHLCGNTGKQGREPVCRRRNGGVGLFTLDHFTCTAGDILFFEIGGNNMLKADSSADFRRGLEALLKKGKPPVPE